MTLPGGTAARRFWTHAEVVADAAGHALMLDGKPVRTPARAALVLPNRALAAAVAAEWEAQGETIRPATMPLTRAANSAIDRVGPQRAAVANMVAAYGESDLLCYRAEHPPGLVARQTAAWDPMLLWADAALGAPLTPTRGVMHAPQPEASLARLRDAVMALDAFELTGLHDLVALSGSLVLGLAVRAGRLDPAEAWDMSRLDEAWQAEHWGIDAEAAAATAEREAAFRAAARLLDLLEDRDA
ncbi:MAG: ATP12 family protein [Pseudomonadota bacterium]